METNIQTSIADILCFICLKQFLTGVQGIVSVSGGSERPESATSGELSSLNAHSLEANVQGDPQLSSPARSPHARSWTVPGV